MSRKIYVEVTTRLIIRADDDAEVADIINEMDYNFKDTTGKADIEDSEVLDYQVRNSK